MRRVIGMGGIFFKSEDPKALREWYDRHLGLSITEWGGSIESTDPEHPEAKVPAINWSPFKKDTPYFAPSEKQFMINYRVENLVALMKVLKEEGVTIVGDAEETPYGKFGWILDPEGNKIELWEPMDES